MRKTNRRGRWGVGEGEGEEEEEKLAIIGGGGVVVFLRCVFDNLSL